MNSKNDLNFLQYCAILIFNNKNHMHTFCRMQGIANSAAHKGIIPRAFEHIFEAIEASDNVKYLVHASYLEIYNEDVRDLLGRDVKKKLELKEHPERGVYVSGLFIKLKIHLIKIQSA